MNCPRVFQLAHSVRKRLQIMETAEPRTYFKEYIIVDLTTMDGGTLLRVQESHLISLQRQTTTPHMHKGMFCIFRCNQRRNNPVYLVPTRITERLMSCPHF